MTPRLHEEEQFQHLLRARRAVSAMEIEAQDGATSPARRGVLKAAVVLLWTIYQAPFRYRDWRPLDEVLAGGDLLQARKAARELAARGILSMRGAVKGPANTTVRIAEMPPYPIE